MKIVVSDAVKDFLKSKEFDCITVNMANTNLCCGSTSMPNIEYVKPAVLSDYDYYKVEDIDIYISKFLRTDEELNFVLKSFLLLKYVEVYGIKLT